MGVEIHSTGQRITLAWTTEHPWSTSLTQRGAELIAEYNDARGLMVRENLSRSTQGSTRTINFVLPDSIRGRAEGPVCLYIKLAANNSILPVRRQSRPGEEAARFRYLSWEEYAKTRSIERHHQLALESVERRIESTSQLISALKTNTQKKGWLSQSDCNSITPSSVAPPQHPPFDVIPLERHDVEARRACLNRLKNTSQLRMHFISQAVSSKNTEGRQNNLRIAASLAGSAAWSAEAVQNIGQGNDSQISALVANRQRQAREYIEDARKFEPSIQKNYLPPIGKQDDHLQLIGGATEIHLKQIASEASDKLEIPIESRPRLTANEVVALAGGMMDTYFGCVGEGRRELKTKMDVWEQIRKEGPERQRMLRDHYAKECRADFTHLSRLQSEQQQLELQAIPLRLQSSSNQVRAEFNPGSKRELLNHLPCKI